MNLTKLAAIAVICILLTSGFALAVKPDTAPGQEKKITGAIGVGRGIEDLDENDTDNGDDDDEDGDEDGDDTEGRVNRGQLVSSVQQARREEFKFTKETLKEAGYHGPMNEFATAYNDITKDMKDGIRERIEAGNNTNLTARIVHQVTMRRLARVRNARLADLNITLDDVDDAINDLINDTNETDGNETDGNESNGNESDGGDGEEGETMGIIGEELEGMDEQMAFILYDIATNGEEEEQEELAENLEEYADSTETGVDDVEIDVETVMDLLEQDADIEEIIEAVTEESE